MLKKRGLGKNKKKGKGKNKNKELGKRRKRGWLRLKGKKRRTLCSGMKQTRELLSSLESNTKILITSMIWISYSFRSIMIITRSFRCIISKFILLMIQDIKLRLSNINAENEEIEYEYVIALYRKGVKRNGILEASSRRSAVAVITCTPVGFVPTGVPLVTSLHPLPLPHSIPPVHGSDITYYRHPYKNPSDQTLDLSIFSTFSI